MQPGGIGTAGGGSELSRGRGGLTRFRSAPETWLEALLESNEEDEVVLDPFKPPTTHSLSQLLLNNSSSLTPTSNDVSTRYPDPTLFEATVPSSGIGFHRQNSSPADLLVQLNSSGSDAYFSNFGIPAKYDSIDVSSSRKPSREVDSKHPSHKFSPQLKGEESGQLHGGMGGITGMLDTEMEKLLEDSVPCRVRAKRGCATHPRSIAERVRRTRISDRIRKLQELVPNMDKL